MSRSREEEIEASLEWEERADNVPVLCHMIAGSIAGVSEHLCMYPLDTFKVCMLRLKTRMFGVVFSVHARPTHPSFFANE